MSFFVKKTNKQKTKLLTFGGVIYLVFTRMPGESYRGRFGSLVFCLCDVFRVRIHYLRLLPILWMSEQLPVRLTK